LAIFWLQKSELRRKWMEIDYDYLRTGTAIGFRAFRGLCSNYLLLFWWVAPCTHRAVAWQLEQQKW